MLRFAGFVGFPLPICMAGIYNAKSPDSKVLNLNLKIRIRTAYIAHFL